MAAARPRGRRFFGAVRKLPSGRYQASYLDPSGTRRTAPETFTAKMDADAWLAMQRAAIESGSWRGRDDRTTVDEFADEWVKALQVRDRTRYHYKVNLVKRPGFGSESQQGESEVALRSSVPSCVTVPCAWSTTARHSKAAHDRSRFGPSLLNSASAQKR